LEHFLKALPPAKTQDTPWAAQSADLLVPWDAQKTDLHESSDAQINTDQLVPGAAQTMDVHVPWAAQTTDQYPPCTELPRIKMYKSVGLLNSHMHRSMPVNSMAQTH
jgi:hypothetical protein